MKQDATSEEPDSSHILNTDFFPYKISIHKTREED